MAWLMCAIAESGSPSIAIALCDGHAFVLKVFIKTIATKTRTATLNKIKSFFSIIRFKLVKLRKDDKIKYFLFEAVLL